MGRVGGEWRTEEARGPFRENGKGFVLKSFYFIEMDYHTLGCVGGKKMYGPSRSRRMSGRDYG